MPYLHQMIALADGKKSWAKKQLTELYHLLQKPELYEGLSRTYRPKDEEGDRLPPESKRIQRTVQGDIAEAVAIQTELLDAVASQDWANCLATADVVVDGSKILEAVPVTYLLFLQKQLIDLRTFVSHLPVLDASEKWERSDEVDAYATQPKETQRTKKVPRNHVVAEATREHPAQVQVYMEDEIVGYWEAIRSSGAMAAKEKNETLGRIRKLQEAVRVAREEANRSEAERQSVGKPLFSFVFGV